MIGNIFSEEFINIQMHIIPTICQNMHFSAFINARIWIENIISLISVEEYRIKFNLE